MIRLDEPPALNCEKQLPGVTIMDNSLKATYDGLLRQSQFLDLDRNPVLLLLSGSNSVIRSSEWALTQYSFLPRVITEFLCRGVVKLCEWPAAQKELLRNLGEELGSRSNGMTHFEILQRCLKNEIGMDLYGDLVPAKATTHMIHHIRSLISDGSACQAAGALYALEASASPELMVVGRLVNVYAIAALGKSVVSEEYTTNHAHRDRDKLWTLDRFLAAHIIDFETGHRDHLAEAVAPKLTEDSEKALFNQGFTKVIGEMEDWWAALAQPPGVQ